MSDSGIMAALRALYGASDPYVRDLREPKSSSHVDYCDDGSCNMTDEQDDFTTVVPRGVAKRLDPTYFVRDEERNKR